MGASCPNGENLALMEFPTDLNNVFQYFKVVNSEFEYDFYADQDERVKFQLGNINIDIQTKDGVLPDWQH